MNTLYQFLFALITAGFFIASNVITAYWVKTNNNLLWIAVFISASIGYIFFGSLIKQTNLSISTGLVDTLLLIISILIGIFILKDVINIQQTVGLILACLAVILLI